jgi:hypothetical protein
MNIFNKELRIIYLYFSELFKNDYILSILNVCIILITIIVLLDIFNIELKENINKENINKEIIYFENFKSSHDELINKMNQEPYDKDNICKNMTNNTCKKSSFCVLLNNNKCVGGDKFGPTYLTNNNKNVDFKYYIHQNKCYGECQKI